MDKAIVQSQTTLRLSHVNDGIQEPDSTVTLSTELIQLLLRVLPKQTSVAILGGELTKAQLNTLLTLAINLSEDNGDIERLVAALLRYV